MKNVLTVKGPGCVRVRASGKSLSFSSAAIASQRMMTGARRTPLRNPSGAIRHGAARRNAEQASDADTRREEDNRSLARDATVSGLRAADTGPRRYRQRKNLR
jgi:hypothetical protein